MIAIDFDSWNYPGLNVAFIVSFIGSIAMLAAIVWYGKRRPMSRQASWGEAMLGSTYIFGLMFLAFGIVPHQWIDHADKDLGWSRDKLLFGPGEILKPQAFGGWFPFTLQYEAIRDIVVVVIHVIYFALFIWLAVWWQKREQVKTAELATSTYGRPLVKKA